MAMPSFAGLRNDDLAAIVNYVRTSWGNTAATRVSPDSLQRMRTALASAKVERPNVKSDANAQAPAPAVAPAEAVAPVPAPAAAPAPQRMAQAAPASSGQGWYTPAEADKGKATFDAKCQMCHGPSLGGGVGPALKGPSFAGAWGNKTLGDLLKFEHANMPMTAPGSLTAQDYRDVAAFILQQNGLPSGDRPMASGADNARVLGLQ